MENPDWRALSPADVDKAISKHKTITRLHAELEEYVRLLRACKIVKYREQYEQIIDNILAKLDAARKGE